MELILAAGAGTLVGKVAADTIGGIGVAVYSISQAIQDW